MAQAKAANDRQAAMGPGLQQTGKLQVTHLTVPSVNVSPEAHSMPNMATMSPAEASVMSSMSLACILPSLGTYAANPTIQSLVCGRYSYKSPLAPEERTSQGTFLQLKKRYTHAPKRLLLTVIFIAVTGNPGL